MCSCSEIKTKITFCWEVGGCWGSVGEGEVLKVIDLLHVSRSEHVKPTK
jgi:hypothetical protein